MMSSKAIVVIAAAIVVGMTAFSKAGTAAEAPITGDHVVMHAQALAAHDGATSAADRDDDAWKAAQSATRDHSLDVRPDHAKESLDTAPARTIHKIFGLQSPPALCALDLSAGILNPIDTSPLSVRGT